MKAIDVEPKTRMIRDDLGSIKEDYVSYEVNPDRMRPDFEHLDQNQPINRCWKPIQEYVKQRLEVTGE